MYFLLRRRITLSNFQHYFIANVAVSDVLVSVAGVFRGLGIIDSTFVGAPNQIKTVYCVLHILLVNNTFASSSFFALIPLTLDRAIAIIRPLHHRSIVTQRTSVCLIVACWFPVIVTLIFDSAAYLTRAIAIEYFHKYHRCMILNDSAIIGRMFLFVSPFFLVLGLYGIMIIFIVRSGRPPSRFLAIASGIILTNLLAVSPSVVTIVWSIPLNYELSQILTVTLYYTNGIFNPLIYLGAHPEARRYFSNLCTRHSTRTTKPLTTYRPRDKASEVKVNSNALEPAEIVHMPDTQL